MRAPVSHAEDWLAQDLHIDAYGSRFTAVGPGGEIPIQCPLIGQHQVDNALTAIAALSALHVEANAISRGIGSTLWPGRLECVRQRPAMFLDGAHNAAGALALAQYIREFHRGKKVWMIFGAMQDKDLGVIAPLLFPLASQLILTAPNLARAYSAESIRELTGETKARVTATVADALSIASRGCARGRRLHNRLAVPGWRSEGDADRVTSSYLFSLLVRAPMIVLDTALMGSISYVTAFFDPAGEKQLKVSRAWARHLLRIAGARVTVVGLDRLDPGTSYVLSPNHVSYMDTPALLANVPNSFRFLAKEELFKIPFIGGHLERGGNISVPLEDPRAALRVLAQAGKGMRERKVSMLVFPEGGRSETGELQPFKDGAALLAIKAQAPVAPIGIIGIRDVLPMHSLHLRPGRVTLRIGEPIQTEGMQIRDRAALTERLCREISALIAQGHA